MNVKKWTLSFLLLFAFSTPLFAKLMRGYVGAELSGNAYQVQSLATTTATPRSNQLNNSLYGAGVGGMLVYGGYFNNFYIGLDALAEYNSANNNISLQTAAANQRNIQYKIKDNFIFGMKFGFVATPIYMGFIDGGAVLSQFSSRSNNAGVFGVTGNVNENMWGGEMGLGVDFKLSRHVHFVTEYHYTMYANFSKNSTTADAPGDVVNTKFDPSNQSVRMEVLLQLV